MSFDNPQETFRAQAIEYVSFVLDDALSADHTIADVDHTATLVGWQCGFDPLFVAILGSTMDTKGQRDVVAADDAVDIATDYLVERKWFSGEPTEPDYVFVGWREK